MKFVWILAAIAAVTTATTIRSDTRAIQDIKPAMTLEEALEGAFEQLRELMRNGDPANGIPVLAPFFEAHLPLDVDLSGLIDFRGEFRNFGVDGLDRFVIDNVGLNLLNLRFTYSITFPDVTLDGWYDLNGSVFSLVPIFGQGHFYLAPRGVTISGFADIGADDNNFLFMPDIEVVARVTSLTSNIEGLLTGGDLSNLINVVIQDLVPSLLNNFQPEISGVIRSFILPFANDLLSTMTIDDLFGLLQ